MVVACVFRFKLVTYTYSLFLDFYFFTFLLQFKTFLVFFSLTRGQQKVFMRNFTISTMMHAAHFYEL